MGQKDAQTMHTIPTTCVLMIPPLWASFSALHHYDKRDLKEEHNVRMVCWYGTRRNCVEMIKKKVIYVGSRTPILRPTLTVVPVPVPSVAGCMYR